MGCGASSGAGSSGGGGGGGIGAPIRPSNEPLTRPANYRHGSSSGGSEITQRMLNNQRSEFWATRVEGSSQIWGALRTSCEALLENDLSLANAIIEVGTAVFPVAALF